MHLSTKIRPAFTMLEIIFVIVILGIVASIGSQIIAQVYESYILQKAISNSSGKINLAATQLVNRLESSIPGTVIARKDDNNFEAIEDNINKNWNILEWIGSDNDGFTYVGSANNRRPAWSGYCDVANSSKDSLSTPGSRLTKLDAIISNLSGSRLSDAAVIFPANKGDNLAHNVGFSETSAGSVVNIHPISSNVGDTNLTLVTKVTRTIKEHYKLTWTAYAVVPRALTAAIKKARGLPKNDTIYDLELYYDYQPWNGEKYNDGKNQILIRNISVFKFTGSGNTIHFKICQRESVGDKNLTINNCKEKVIMR